MSQGLVQSLLQLRTCPKELWLVLLIEIIESFAFFAVALSLVLYLSKDFGFDDIKAGWVYGVHGLLVSVFGLSLGFVIDMFGVRTSLLFSQLALLVGRLCLSVASTTSSMYIGLFVVIPIGQALLQPAITTGIRRFTSAENRTMGFSLFYVAMNVGALMSAPMVDLIRSQAPQGLEMPLVGQLGAYRTILFIGAIPQILAIVLVLFMKDIDISAAEQGHEPKSRGSGSPLQIFKEVVSSARFWKFMLLIVLLVGVGVVLRLLYALFPKYMVRTQGETVPFGSILSINPFLVIFIVPALTGFLKGHSQFSIILTGSAITSASVLWMAISPQLWCAVMFVVTVSLGEALWSPRVFEYTSTIAPKGREGTYMALSTAPTFMAKVLVGGMSGWLLEEYCPSTESCDGRTLWLIVFAVTASSPVLMFLLRNVLGAQEQEDAPNNSKAMAGVNQGQTATQNQKRKARKAD